MLNELEQLRRSLKENGVQATAWHPSIKPLAKYSTLLVRLNDQGVPASVSLLPREQAAKLRSIQPDNQKSFPAFNLKSPIFRAPPGLDASSAELVIEPDIVPSLEIAYEQRNGKWKDLERIKRLLREFPTRELAPKLRANAQEPVLASTLHLLHLLENGKQEPPEFLRSFAEALIRAGQSNDLPNEQVLDVLFGKLDRKGVRGDWQCILYLEVQDLRSFPSAVADPEAATAWSDALLEQMQQATLGATVECALDGHLGPAIGDKMPNPNLPLLGGTYLFSMNSEIPCQSRYGHSSTQLFPVTRHAVQGVNDALLHMTAKDREGETWSAVPSGTSEKPDLLIAYIEEMPDAHLAVAAIFGEPGTQFDDPDSEEEESAGNVSASAQMSAFVQRLKGLIEAVHFEEGTIHGTRHLRLFVLSTIDKGRKQVLFDARYSVDHLDTARKCWVAGVTNAPSVDIRIFQGKGKKKKSQDLPVPSPVQVARSFRDLWIRGGERSERVAGVSLGRVYHLLLDSNPMREASWLLERFLPLKIDLLIAAGKPSRDEKTGTVYSYTGAALSGLALSDLRTTVAVLGILLNLLGRTKETYMKERDYLLGQLLQFADRLHIVYCHGIRGGQVPPQLIGNSLLGQAGQNPAKALAILHQRLPVYERYATQLLNSAEPVVYGEEEKDKEKKRLARLKHSAWKQAGWVKATLAVLSRQVHQLGLEPTPGPQGQAELLLGYLAAPATKEDEN